MTPCLSSCCAALLATVLSAPVMAQDLPAPLRLPDVVRLAGERRAEIEAVRASASAAEARAEVVAALEDPMLSSSLDHLPFSWEGADYSFTIEQRFPLSGLRQHRRAAVLAERDRLTAEASRARLDVQIQAANAFLMLWERRRTAALLAEQIAFARDVVTAADARYASGTAPQADVLRAELEVARLQSLERAIGSEVRAAEAMVNASLAREADRLVPPLEMPPLTQSLPDWAAVKGALEARPELRAGRAQLARADAEIEVMRDMFRPMATLRTGPSYTMAEGTGWMAMFGVSLPIYGGKLRAGVAEAQAMRAMSEADLRAMSRMFEGEAAGALNQLQAARDRRVAIATDVLPRARMAIDPAVAGYTAGQLPLVSVIEAVQALWLVQANLITADTDLGLAWARLGRARGSFEGIVP